MKHMYYTIWQLLDGIQTNNKPAANAVLLLTLFQIINLYTFGIIFVYFSCIRIPMLSRTEAVFVAIPLVLLLLLINYFFLYKNRDELLNKYNTKSKRNKIIGTIIMALYMLLSIAMLAYFGPKYTEYYLATMIK